MKLKRLAKTALTRALPAALALSLTGAADPQQICENRTGTHDGFFYTFWKDGGTACMTLSADGSYSIRYELGGKRNLVAGKGWATGSTTRRIGYNAGVFVAGSNSYLTLYGWSTDPLVEYYVVENWGGFTPPGGGATRLGQVTTDGGTYDIYRTRRVEAPSIRGTQTFDQFWSVRTAKRATGTDNTITFANHVAAWRSHGMRLGAMHYQVLATEGFGANGSSSVTVRER